VTTVVVVQARTGSTRYPEKVLADLCGRPVLEHVLTRAARARCADAVVVATTAGPGDDRVEALARSLGMAVTRGSETDVLGRYAPAAREHRADVVVRVTADCPLLDPRLIDRVVRALLREDAEYAGNVTPPTYPDGYDVEALTAACLGRLDAEASLPHEREHVTLRARDHPGSFRTATVRCRRDLSGIRLTVDVPDDLVRIRAVLGGMPADPPPGLGAVLARLQEVRP